MLRRGVVNTGKVGSGKGVGAVLDVVFLAMSARALGPDVFGTMTLILSYVHLVRGLVKWQSWHAVVRYGAHALASGRPAAARRLILTTELIDIATALAAAALAALLVPWLGPVLGWPPSSHPVAALFCAAIVLTTKSTPNGVLRLFDRFDLLAVVNAAMPAVRCGIGLAAFMAGGGLAAFLGAYAAGMLVGVVALHIWAGRELRRRGLLPSLRTRLRGVRAEHPGLLGFMASANVNVSLQLLPRHLAPLVVGALLGPAAAGLLRVAQTGADALAAPAKLMTRSLSPDIARLTAGEVGRRMRRTFRDAALLGGAGAAAAWGLLWLVGERAIVLAAGAPYDGAYPLMLVLALASVAWAVALPAEPTLYGLGRPGVITRVRACEAAVYVVLLLALVPVWGIMAAAAAAAVTAAAAATALMVAAARMLQPARDRRQPSGKHS